MENQTPTETPAATEKTNPLPIIALVMGIVGLIFSFASGKFLLVLALLLCLAALVMAFIALKASKALAITTIVISLVGLLFSVTGFSRDKKTAEKKETPISTNNNVSAPAANTNSSPQAETNANKSAQSAVALPNTFTKKEFGYSINYPDKWTSNVTDFGVEFTGPKGSPEEDMTFRIQNVLFKSKGGKYENLDDGINQLMNQIKQGDPKATFGQINDIGTDLPDGTSLQGKGVDLNISVQGKPYKGAMAIISYAPASVFYILEYYSPQDRFANAMNIAVSMINSWKIGQ